MKPSEISNLPLSPGCYIFKNKAGEVIYVGKAKQLKKRVSSYFRKKDHDAKTSMLVPEIDEIDFFQTRNETEALLLENSLIKKYYPKFNIDMKDAQKYAYLHLTSGPLPWLEVERARDNKGEYYGPFVSGAIRKQISDILTRNFKILYKKPSPRMKKLINPQDYAERVEQARKILRGNVSELISDLKKEMESASKKTYYEYAQKLKSQIEALESLKEKQIIEQTKSVDSNIVNYILFNEKVYLLIFTTRKGVLEGKQEYVFDYTQDFLDEFLLRYFDSAPIPSELIVPEKIDEAFEDYLTKKKGRKVSVIIPEKGDKKELLELVLKNIESTFFPGKEKLIQLQKALNLPRVPFVLECFDISHLSGTNTVASMVTFKNGSPDKSNYRRYKIRADISGDDFAAMKEVIERRYSKIKRENLPKPDLIIVDGGLPQLSAGTQVLKQLHLNIPIISLAKKFEEIYVPGSENTIRLAPNNKGLQLLQAIRDEAHRFAISYQKLLRRKEITK
jgi:excinuclease ABC subunit C